MPVLYNIFIYFYYYYILFASLFNKKARQWVAGRKDLFNRLSSAINPDDKLAWFHCASLGEFEQGRPVIEAFKKKHPEFRIMLTFFSSSGYNIRKNYKIADCVIYLPVDTRRNAKKFIELANPTLAVIVKYEFWFNIIGQLHKRKIPVFIISANFRPGQHFFKWYGRWFRKMLKKISLFFVQYTDSKELLEKIGIDKVIVSGDTRFDRVAAIAGKKEDLPFMDKFRKEKTIILAGSTWPKDEDILLEYYREAEGDLKLIIAPHEVHEERIRQLEAKIKSNFIRYTKIEDNDPGNADILIIDTIGLLSGLYRYAKIAYIGGGFGVGIHNILEAVTFGKPVIFGPNYQKFREARELIQVGGAFSISKMTQFKEIINKLLDDPHAYTESSGICTDYISLHKGATDIILSKLDNFI